jgi:hypothetical protein
MLRDEDQIFEFAHSLPFSATAVGLSYFAWSTVFEQNAFLVTMVLVFTEFSPSPSFAWKIYSS